MLIAKWNDDVVATLSVNAVFRQLFVFVVSEIFANEAAVIIHGSIIGDC